MDILLTTACLACLAVCLLALAAIWQNALVGRTTNVIASVQAELCVSGDFSYRYSPGVTNFTSLIYRRLDPVLDSQTNDRDGDGLPTADEMFVHGTDPGISDTDYDGLRDGAEVVLGTDPMCRDTDCDGFADGTDPNPLSADPWADFDGDGLPDAWKDGWFGTNAVVSASDDANGDGISNLAALLTGADPVAVPASGFAFPNGAAAACVEAWEIVPTAFSFACPSNFVDIVTRTLNVRRTSPWEQFYVSSRPGGAGGWAASDVLLLYGLDGEPATNAVPAATSDSWRLPLGSAMPQTVTFRLAAAGATPTLSASLYLLRWAPRVSFAPSERLAVIRGQDGRTWAAAKRDPESGMYEVSFDADLSRIPHLAGADAEAAADLALPPVGGLSVSNGVPRTLLASDPLAVDLPREGTNLAARLVLYSVEVSRPGSVSSGPRESRYASPYPLTSSSLRKAFHAASGGTPGFSEMTIQPAADGIGYAVVGGAPLRSPPRMRGASAAAWPVTVFPPIKFSPSFGGEACTNDIYEIAAEMPDDHDETPPEDDSPKTPGSGGGDDGCGCGDGGPSLGSFRIRIPLGESAAGENLGYLWSEADGPFVVTPAAFRVLAAPPVSVTTNAGGVIVLNAAAAGGRRLVVTNVAHGVAVAVWNASGRFESQWEVFNEGGDESAVRVRKVTVLGNGTLDETYEAWTEEGADVWMRTDNIAGVSTVRRIWRDPDEPEFVVAEEDETFLDESLVRHEGRSYERLGAGGTARRRLVYACGYDENGQYEETRTYWRDAGLPERHARLRSVRFDRAAWAYFDYDGLGRETLRIEQFDGSAFPELADVSSEASLPEGCAAKVTVTSYEPSAGDDAHRNDSFEPREVTVSLRRGAEPPVAVSRETRVYVREEDAAGVPLRRVERTVGLGGLTRTDTTVEYPQDGEVPRHLRGMPVFETSPDGTATTTEYVLSGGRLVATSRRYGSSSQPQPSQTPQFPTYNVTVSDAAYRLPIREETRLTATGALLSWTEKTYDDIHRLRSVAYSDGTSETNAYSCCRLLWKRDRDGRKTLRSAQTGTDGLYYAEEEVWLADVSTNGFRVTRHWFDGFGRETNTVVHAGSVPGEASSMSSPCASHPSYTSRTTTTYHDEFRDGSFVRIDGRGLETDGYSCGYEDRDESHETVYGESGGEPFFLGTSTVRNRNGGTTTETMWSDNWRREAVVPGHLPDGRRVEYAVTSASDHSAVTNSISTYDLLGRLESVATPGANGTWLVVSNAYDGATTRMLSTTQHAPGLEPRTTAIIYNDHGEQAGTVLDGVTNRTDVTYAQFSNEWWKVESAIVAGLATNFLRIVMTQLTGRTDTCRRHEIESVGSSVPLARRTETLVSYDPASDIETETVTSSVAPTVVRRYRHGVLLSSETGGTTTFSSYDAFGRVAETGRSIGNSSPMPVQSFDYSPCGDLLATYTYTNDTDTITESYVCDMQGNRTATTNVLGDVVIRSYDPFGRVVAEDDATYPVRCAYDTAGRRTALSTTRDGSTWDTTTWAYDAATGNCLTKTYADGSTVTYSYTPDNLPLRTTYASGRWKENVYDARREVIGVMYSDDEIVSFSYDSFGNEIAASNEVSSVASLRSEQGDCTNETAIVGNESKVTIRAFDEHRRLTEIDGTIYEYNPDGLLASISNGIVLVEYAYTPDLLDAGYALALSNGIVFTRSLARDGFRRSLVSGIANSGSGTAAENIAYVYDALNRPTSRNGDTFSYNARGEVVFSRRDAENAEGSYLYDDIGNLLLSAFNTVTNTYTANSLNQCSSVFCASASLREISHDTDGNMTQFGDWTCTYDVANRLKTVSSNGVLIVANFYDAKSRRVKKVTSEATTTFFYDDWNLVEERIAYTNGTMSTIRYFWGKDLSGALQGAGGVGGLLYLTIDDVTYIPTYDNNGNVTRYLDANGNTAAQYTYDAFGKIVAKSGSMADVFRHCFSTKYFDVETGLYYYGYRFYSQSLMRWLNRDPIEERGGLNLYSMCRNCPVFHVDKLGLYRWVVIYYSRADQAEFRSAAETYRREIEQRSDFNPICDSVIVKGALTTSDFCNAWNDINKATNKPGDKYKIKSLHIFSHSGPGALFLRGTTLSSKQIMAMPRLNWASDGTIVCHGCNTGVHDKDNTSVAKSFAVGQGVLSQGQTGFAQFSENPHRRTWFTRVDGNSKNVYLWSYGDGGPSWTFGDVRPPQVEYPQDKESGR